MKIKLLLIRLIVITFLVFSLSGRVNAQCSVTGLINASTLTCGVAPLSSCNGVVYIGDGTTTTILTMNAPLNLTCLGTIQLVVKNNAAIDFSPGNDRLTLADGSGIAFEGNGTLVGGSCNASERIYIGSDLVATCNGGAGADYTFAQLVAQGGYNSVTVLSKTSVCGSGTATINVSMIPAPTSSVTYKLYDASTGGALLSTINSTVSPYTATFTTPSISSTTSFYVEAIKGSLTTPRKEVVITVNTLPTPTLSSNDADNAFCAGTSVMFTATGGINYNFRVAGSSVQNGSSATYTTTTLTNGQVVDVIVTNSSGCVATSSGIVNTVNTLPIPTLSSNDADNSFCVGTSVMFTATGGTNYNFRVAGSSVQNGSSVTYTTTTLTNGQVVDVIVTNSSGCVATSSGIVNTVNALPTPTLSSNDVDNTFCVGTSVIFTASGGINYNFRVAGSSVQNGTSATYTTTTLTNGQVVDVIVTNSSGCVATSSGIANTVNALPVVTTQPTDQLDCEKRSVKFKAVATGSGTLSFVWESKLPGESAFTSANSDSNVTYPNSPTQDEIRIANVGSSKSLNGTLYQVKITDGNLCSVISNTVTLSVNEIIGVTGGTDVTQCFGTNYSYAVSVSPTSLPNVVSYQWKKSVVSGVWNDVVDAGVYSGAKAATLSITGGAPSESAEYRVYVTFNNSTTTCSVDSASRIRKITFQPQLAAPMATITPPNCSNPTGTLTVTGVNAGDAFSFDGGAFQPSNIKSGLGLGNYIVVLKNASGCVSLPATYNVDWSAAVWNGSSWSKTPTSDDVIVFDGNYSSIADLSGCSCLVKSGNVVFNSAHTLSLLNAIIVTGGTFTLENNASLIQVNGVSNSGSINVKRNSAPAITYDYTYWSSPTSGTQSLSNFAPNSNPKFMLTYDNGWNFMSPGSVFSKGIGYAILAPDSYSIPTIFNGIFVGVPNNGNINVPVIYLSSSSSKLVGNPYPSALDADKFIAANSTTTTGTLYFWTHNHAKKTSGYIDDYAVYNTTGGTAVSTGHANKTAPTKWIASGQGFVVDVKAPGSIVFNNSMRIKDAAYNNTNFYRSSSIVNSEKVLEKHRIWLNLVNDSDAFSQTLLGYVESATNGSDFGFDGLRIGENKLEFYSLIDKNPYVIQARALPFSNEDEVPLGYKTSKSGSFKIAIDNLDGLFSDIDGVVIVDRLLGISHNLKDSPYSFSSGSGVFNNRFVLKYDSTARGLNELLTHTNQVMIISNDRNIYIQTSLDFINQVFVYDILGRQVFENKKVNSNNTLISNLDEQQVLVVKAILNNGQIVTKKIIN